MTYSERLSPFTGNLSLEAHAGVGYLDFLECMLDAIDARSYLEIGTATGLSLARVRCPSACVDPNFRFEGNPTSNRELTLLYQLTSDEFFERCDPRAALGGEIDVVFLDGMHLFECALRDLMNAETMLTPDSVVLLHDALPLNSRMAQRECRLGDPEQEPTWQWWTGDVWKLVFALKQHRPDLEIALLDCSPTGLVMITKLDPTSRVLAEAYPEILSELMDRKLDEARRRELFSCYPAIKTNTFGHDQMANFLTSWGVRESLAATQSAP